MNQELENYIKQERGAGTSDEVIKQKLLDNGWKDEVFNEYFINTNQQQPVAPINNSSNNQGSKIAHVSPKNKKIGIFWLVAPALFLIMILIVYAIVRFATQYSDNSTLFGVMNIALGVLGLIATLMIVVGIPIGIIYFNKKEYTNIQFDPRSGKGNASEIPNEIKGWNWGAAGLTWIWGLSNGVWLSLLVFVPFFGAIWWIFLGVKGNKWAWQSSQWVSVEEFQKSQDKWKVWGIIVMMLPALVVLFIAITIFRFII